MMSHGKAYYGSGIPHVDPSRLKGKLIVLEGSDGSGRSTQIAMLRNWLEREGFATVEIGIKRSELAAPELEGAKRGNTLSPMTMSLFYMTDFADQLEHVIIPSLRANFVVLADRYIYTLMARSIVRGLAREWLSKLYGIAVEPDAVFYLKVPPRVLAERTFRKNAALDYWESGMDIQRSVDMYRGFIRYQRRIEKTFESLQSEYQFETIDGNRSPEAVHQDLVARIATLLGIPTE